MTREEATAELMAAGAEWVGFKDDYGFVTGIGIGVGDQRTAQAWSFELDLTAQAVGKLKEWLADNARPR